MPRRRGTGRALTWSDITFGDWLRLELGPRARGPAEGPIHIESDDDIRRLWPAIREPFLASQRKMNKVPGTSYAERLMGEGPAGRQFGGR